MDMDIRPEGGAVVYPGKIAVPQIRLIESGQVFPEDDIYIGVENLVIFRNLIRSNQTEIGLDGDATDLVGSGKILIDLAEGEPAVFVHLRQDGQGAFFQAATRAMQDEDVIESAFRRSLQQ